MKRFLLSIILLGLFSPHSYASFLDGECENVLASLVVLHTTMQAQETDMMKRVREVRSIQDTTTSYARRHWDSRDIIFHKVKGKINSSQTLCLISAMGKATMSVNNLIEDVRVFTQDAKDIPTRKPLLAYDVECTIAAVATEVERCTALGATVATDLSTLTRASISEILFTVNSITQSIQRMSYLLRSASQRCRFLEEKYWNVEDLGTYWRKRHQSRASSVQNQINHWKSISQ